MSNKKYYNGEKESRLYREWKAMRWRCNPKNKGSAVYKRKHIKVCEQWNDFYEFQKWALTHGYTDNLSLDRIDSNGDYMPSNCQWIPMIDNLKKVDKTDVSHKVIRVDIDNNIMVFKSEREAARYMKRDRKAIRYRLKGYNNHFLEGYYWYYEKDFNDASTEYIPTR